MTTKCNDTDTDIVVDPLLWFIGMQKDWSSRQDLDKAMLDYYKKETILASKICSHERLNKLGDQRLKRYKGPDAGKKNLEDIWVLFDQMAQNKTNLTLVTDSTHFPPLNICDVNAISGKHLVHFLLLQYIFGNMNEYSLIVARIYCLKHVHTSVLNH